MSLRQAYQTLCTELKVKCNSAVVQQLPDTSAAASGFVAWDLSGNVVGTKGAAAILRLVQDHIPQLQHLILSGNNLSSSVTKDLLNHLRDHPSIVGIDLSSNDIRLGGPELIELLKKNKRITKLNIENTYLRPLFVRLIGIQLRKNNGSLGNSLNAGAPTSPPFAAAGGDDKFSFGDPGHHEEEGSAGAFAAAENAAFAAFRSSTAQIIGGGGGGGKVPRRPTVCAEVYKEEEIESFVPQVVKKDTKVTTWLMQLLEKNDLFSHLEDFELSIAVNAMEEMERAKGDEIFSEGDDEGDTFYIVGSGELELTSKGEHFATLKKGDCTQNLRLLYAGTTTETGVCATDCVIYTIDRKTYKCVLSKASKKKRKMYEGFLKSVGFLKGLTGGEILQLADALKPATFESGASLIRYGEIGETFFLIVEGVVEVYGRDDAKQPIKVCEFTTGDCVGELEFINNHKCVADVKAKSAVRVAKMNRHHFEMVMGPVKEVLARIASESTVYEYYRSQLQKMDSDKLEEDKHQQHAEGAAAVASPPVKQQQQVSPERRSGSKVVAFDVHQS